MSRILQWVIAAILLGSTATFASCSSKSNNAENSYEQATYIPQAPDYNDPTMWVTANGDTDGTGADIFYVVSTWEEDWKTEDGRICHYADVWNSEHRKHMGDLEINKVVAYMSPGHRFFAPFYRHTTMEAWMTQNEVTIKNRTRLSIGDVCAVSGYSGSEYAAYKGFLNVGDIHSCEPWLYSECLAENITVRVKEWRKLHSSRVH